MTAIVRDTGHDDKPGQDLTGGDAYVGADYTPEMGIGRKIKERREELGIGVSALARQVGLSRQTLYDLEREKQTSTTKLHLLCKALGLNPDWVESNRGPRLTPMSGIPVDAHSPMGASLVGTDQNERTVGVDMAANLAREVLEAGLLLAALPENVRAAVMGMIRSMATETEKTDEDARAETRESPSTHLSK